MADMRPLTCLYCHHIGLSIDYDVELDAEGGDETVIVITCDECGAYWDSTGWPQYGGRTNPYRLKPKA